jgi:hypothetical protein
LVLFTFEAFSFGFADVLYHIPATYGGYREAVIACPLSNHVEVFKPW